jgi:DNA polymerase-3 subunit epsilon
MRQVVLDTETTGLSWERGNRVVEIGCIELMERRPTGLRFQRYLNPGRELEPGAQEVTGLTLEFLSDKPLFAQVAVEFLDFIRGAELIIHNADFDVGFLDYELGLLGGDFGRIRDHAGVLDTLRLARERFPGQRNSLDALCRRLGVDNGHRKLHGALLDAELLAEVYLSLTAGQGDLGLSLEAPAPEFQATLAEGATAIPERRRILRASAEEQSAHLERLEKIGKKSGGRLVWPQDAAAVESGVELELAV